MSATGWINRVQTSFTAIFLRWLFYIYGKPFVGYNTENYNDYVFELREDSRPRRQNYFFWKLFNVFP